MTDVPPEAEVPTPPPQPQPAPPAARPPGPSRPPWLPIAIAVAAVVVLGVGYALMSGRMGGSAQAPAYAVQTFTPTTEIVAARERVEARAQPDASAPIVVVFGQGATINVTGRVSRGLGDDWYAVSWNNQTAFVRQADAVSGTGAPPTPEVREEEPEEEEDKPPPFPELDEEEQVAEAPPPPRNGLGLGDVDWIREPSSRDFARYYPTAALDDGQSGRVVLDCVIGGNGRLSCSVAEESPGGYGFAQAALNISRQTRVRTRLRDGSNAVGEHIRLPLNFRAG